jgi:hypothetical protein
MVHRDDVVPVVCKDLDQDLVLYYYGECAEKERKRIETHLQGCVLCRRFLEDLRALLPLTEKPDEPPQAFWESYSREMRKKLAAAEQRGAWWRSLPGFLRPWPVPAMATALILLLAVTLTFTRGLWRSQDLPPEEQALLETLPNAENLEFFKAMDFLDSMDLLEAVEEAGAGRGAV